MVINCALLKMILLYGWRLGPRDVRRAIISLDSWYIEKQIGTDMGTYLNPLNIVNSIVYATVSLSFGSVPAFRARADVSLISRVGKWLDFRPRLDTYLQIEFQ